MRRPRRSAAAIAPGSGAADFIGTESSQRIGPAAAESLRELGIEATNGLAVPLRSRGQGLGVLLVVDRLGEGPAFSADQQLTLESFATSAANAIAAAHAIEDEKAKLAIASSERERGRWARELHDETLQELGRAADHAGERFAGRLARGGAGVPWRPPTSRSGGP